jgi:CheY-like chemotaxis protein
MMRRTILLAENHDETRETCAKVLEKEGYAVRLASTPQEARVELERGRIDLAVIDVRLEHDELPSDTSGLELAADKAFRYVPKIMLSAFATSYEGQRKVWRVVGGEPPAVVAFVGKEERPQVLLSEIRHALEEWPHLSMLSSKVSEQIKSDHGTIRSQAQWNYVASFIMSILGFSMIAAGIVLVWMGRLVIGVAGSAAGLLMEALGYLSFRQLERANRRMDVYHRELLQTYGLEFLLSAAERLPAERQSVCVERAICAVLDSWYPEGSKTRHQAVSMPAKSQGNDQGSGLPTAQK